MSVVLINSFLLSSIIIPLFHFPTFCAMQEKIAPLNESGVQSSIKYKRAVSHAKKLLVCWEKSTSEDKAMASHVYGVFLDFCHTKVRISERKTNY